MGPFHEQWLQLTDDAHRHRKLTADSGRIATELAQQQQLQQRLEQRLREEDRDVRRLEGLSLWSLFHSVLGDRGERLEEERQQFLAARLQLETAQLRLEALERQAADCRQQLQQLGNLKARRAELLARREADLRAGTTPAGEALTALAESLAGARANQRALAEAIDAGEQAQQELGDAENHLDNARSWGRFDLAGGGLLATSFKHSNIDLARSAVDQAQTHLDRFARELQDVDADPGSDWQLGGFAKFADFFFDGLIVDWVVQRRIVRALEGVKETRARVDELLKQLEPRLQRQRERLQQLEAERVRLLLG